MFKKSYPASVLAAAFLVIAAKQESVRTGNHLSLAPKFLREPDAEYEVMLSSENKDSLIIRINPNEQAKTRHESNLKRWRQELHDLKPALNERIDAKDPRADIRNEAKNAAVQKQKDLQVAIRTAELSLLDIGAPSEDRISIADLASVVKWSAVPDGEYEFPAPVEEEPVEDEVDPLDAILRDTYDALAKVSLPEGTTPLPAWEAADPATVAGLRAEIQQLADTPDATPQALHDDWMKAQLADGWEYGAEEDTDGKKHPMLLAYDQLPSFVRDRDELLLNAARQLRTETEAEAETTEEPETVKGRAKGKGKG